LGKKEGEYHLITIKLGHPAINDKNPDRALKLDQGFHFLLAMVGCHLTTNN
jgi:hypothetical protein